MKTKYRGVSPEALQIFLSYNWPGNIRELRNVIERAMILSDGNMILPQSLPNQMKSSFPVALKSKDLKGAVQSFEGTFIKQVLVDCKWNKEEAARRLNINPSTLYRKMSELKITDPTTTK
jgi:two-component system response regulator AtoC